MNHNIFEGVLRVVFCGIFSTINISQNMHNKALKMDTPQGDSDYKVNFF